MIDLDEQADTMLVEYRRTLPTCHDKFTEFLTEDQWRIRRKHEILIEPRTFDLYYRRGIYGRVWAEHPHRPSATRRYSPKQDPWSQDAYESYWGN